MVDDLHTPDSVVSKTLDVPEKVVPIGHPGSFTPVVMASTLDWTSMEGAIAIYKTHDGNFSLSVSDMSLADRALMIEILNRTILLGEDILPEFDDGG